MTEDFATRLRRFRATSGTPQPVPDVEPIKRPRVSASAQWDQWSEWSEFGEWSDGDSWDQWTEWGDAF
jgi:hypothetical protein